MKVLLTLTLLASALGCAQASLAVYNFSAVINATGNGIDTTTRVSGVFIVDLEDGRAIRIGRFRINGTKRMLEGEENLRVWRAQGRTGTRTMVVSGETVDDGFAYQETTMHYSGKDSYLNLGPVYDTLPKSVKGAGYTIVDDGGAFAYGISTQTASHTYSAKSTQQANWAGQTLESAASQFRNLYIGQGYVP